MDNIPELYLFAYNVPCLVQILIAEICTAPSRITLSGLMDLLASKTTAFSTSMSLCKKWHLCIALSWLVPITCA